MANQNEWLELTEEAMETLDSDAGYKIALFSFDSYLHLADAMTGGGVYEVSDTLHGRSVVYDVVGGMKTAMECLDGGYKVQFLYRLANGVSTSEPATVAAWKPTMEIRSTGSGGNTAYFHEEPSAPGLYAFITDDSCNDAPDNLETDAMIIGVYLKDDSADKGTFLQVKGRAGLNAWYKENVGYSPDEDIGGETPILELLKLVVSHLMIVKQEKLDAPDGLALEGLVRLFPDVGFTESGESHFSCNEGSGTGLFVSISRNDMCITNPYQSSNGMDFADPEAEYGIPREAADFMLMINTRRLRNIAPVQTTINTMSPNAIEAMLDEAVVAAVNAGCLVIQQAIKQTDGGIAGIHFSDSAEKARFKECFRAYFALEEMMHNS